MEDTSVIIGIVVGLLSIVSCGGAAVWVVATIQATTAQLTRAIEGLAQSVDRLDSKTDNHSERIIRLEAVREHARKNDEKMNRS